MIVYFLVMNSKRCNRNFITVFTLFVFLLVASRLWTAFNQRQIKILRDQMSQAAQVTAFAVAVLNVTRKAISNPPFAVA